MTYISKTAYNLETGKILYVTSGDRETVVFPTQEGIGYVNGVGDSNTQEVVNGHIVSKPDSVLEQQEIDTAWSNLISERNKRLYATDWTQVPDAPVDQQAFANYRQALRDLPANTTDPREVAWPEAPNS